MSENVTPDKQPTTKPKLYRFHPLVRFSMILLSMIAAGYSIYFIFFLIPRYQDVTAFVKIASVVVLYVALNTLYKHLTSLNSVIIRDDRLELSFLLKKKIVIPWFKLTGMQIYKVITHFWKITYKDDNDVVKTFKTSLAFPGIMDILLKIQDQKPDIEMNELLSQVLQYKRTI
ncbi:MAG: hypothetical protein R6V77_07095 [Candidatus Cloacimonadaceae bacterium]